MFSHLFRKALLVAALPLCVFGAARAADAKPAAKPAAAPAAEGNRLAYVDMQSAITQTDQGKAAKAKIEKEAEAKRKELLDQQSQLKKLDEEFQAQQAVLSDEKKAEKQREFQGLVEKLRSGQMSFEQEVRQKESAEMQKILQNLAVVIEDAAKRKGYDLVFERGSGALLYAAKIDDITDEVVKSYNAKHKAGGK